MMTMKRSVKAHTPATMHLRLGARASTLSMAQSELFAKALMTRHPGLEVEIVPISTTGDEIQDRPLHEFGGKGLFTKQLEQALLAGDVDFAVHSYKDVPVTMPLVDTSNLSIVATPLRENPCDVLVSRKATFVGGLPKGAKVGTGSLRRKAQLLALRPDLRVELIRGNIDTRLRKLEHGEFDAIILAAAGLYRAFLFDASYMTRIPIEDLMPAAGQGALAVQCRGDCAHVARLLAVLNDPDSALAVALEREVVRLLDGDCHSPIGAYATIERRSVALRACVAQRDGTPPLLSDMLTVPRAHADQAPARLVEAIASRGGRCLLCK